MEEKKSLTKAETKNLFSRLELVYGAALRARWQDLPWTEVMGDWAARLGDFTGDSEAINYALEHLPDDFPPTVIAFKKLCEQGAKERAEREREAVRLELERQFTPEGKEWVWITFDEDDGCGGTSQRMRRELVAIGSGLPRAPVPADVRAKVDEEMRKRGLVVLFGGWK